MIGLYCRKTHKFQGLCPECAALIVYSEKKIAKCVWKDDKPVCTNCSIHCFNIGMREKIRRVMRYSGPRMILIHPFLAIEHLIRTLMK